MTKPANFRKPKPRFDFNRANDGVWHYPQDEVGNDYDGFRLGLLDPSIPRVRATAERAQRTLSNKKQNEEALRRMNVETILKSCLVDWEVTDSEGKAVPFSMDTAIEYFMTKCQNENTGKEEYVFDFVFADIMRFVQDVSNFQPEDVLGN